MTYNEQSAYLSGTMSMQEPKRRRKDKTDATSKKLTSFTYCVALKNDEATSSVPVCKKTLCDIFKISMKKIQVLQMKMKEGKIDMKDGRGKHDNRPNRISEDVKIKIRDHINSFPKHESHYSRAKSNSLYLHPDLTLKKMYSLFIEQYPELQVKFRLYRDVFAQSQYKFGMPRSDTCRYCDKLYMQLQCAETAEAMVKITQESDLHHIKAEAGYRFLKEDIASSKLPNSNKHVLCVDLQQVLFCPTLTHSSVFYQRQYSCYNFCIHNGGTNEARMNLWHESVAGRGSAEIASSILKYVQDRYSILEKGEERHLILWSDRCVGQNNNWKIVTLCHYLIQCRYFTQVEQKFLCSGHSFLPCDRNFALIEKRKKVSKVFVPDMWKEVIEGARDANPFEVKVLQQEDFKDFSHVEKNITKNPGLKITQYMWFRYSVDDIANVNVRASHNLFQPWHTFLIFNKKKPQLPARSPLPLLYKTPVKISFEKKRKFNGHV